MKLELGLISMPSGQRNSSLHSQTPDSRQNTAAKKHCCLFMLTSLQIPMMVALIYNIHPLWYKSNLREPGEKQVISVFSKHSAMTFPRDKGGILVDSMKGS